LLVEYSGPSDTNTNVLQIVLARVSSAAVTDISETTNTVTRHTHTPAAKKPNKVAESRHIPPHTSTRTSGTRNPSAAATLKHENVPAKADTQPSEAGQRKPPGNPEEHYALRVYLERELARHFHYPLMARRKGWQGEVILSFTLGRSGVIHNARIALGSGYRMLDSAALATLNKIGKLDHGPQQPIRFELPLTYRLQEG
jgi:protein TonB